MEQLECIQLDQWVHLPRTFENPEYFPDYIAVAAEECSGSYSQGSKSFISFKKSIRNYLVEIFLIKVRVFIFLK